MPPRKSNRLAGRAPTYSHRDLARVLEITSGRRCNLGNIRQERLAYALVARIVMKFPDLACPAEQETNRLVMHLDRVHRQKRAAQKARRPSLGGTSTSTRVTFYQNTSRALRSTGRIDYTENDLVRINAAYRGTGCNVNSPHFTKQMAVGILAKIVTKYPNLRCIEYEEAVTSMASIQKQLADYRRGLKQRSRGSTRIPRHSIPTPRLSLAKK